MDDRSLPDHGDRSEQAELERIAFGPGHTPEEVLAASTALRELRERDAREREPREQHVPAGVDSAPAASGHPLPDPAQAPTPAGTPDGAAPRSRRALVGGAVLLAVVCAAAGYAAGASRAPAADPAASDRGTERTGDLGLYAERADPVAAAAVLFETERDDDDVLATAVATVDPASVRAVARTGNARFWIARDYDGGYCLVFARYRDSEVIGQEPFCATGEQFAESGNHVALNGYRVDWTGGEVEIGVTTN